MVYETQRTLIHIDIVDQATRDGEGVDLEGSKGDLGNGAGDHGTLQGFKRGFQTAAF